MELTVVRKFFTDISTISEYSVNGIVTGFFLEDRDRGLSTETPLLQIKQIKVFGKTAIPVGRYEIAVNFSNKFKKFLPLLVNVPGFDGIRIHVGNFEADTLGCLLPGTDRQKDMVLNSKKAFNALFSQLMAVIKKEKIFITIIRDEEAFLAFSATEPPVNQPV
ncbi:DUF5675 family protein [Larkinella knui]|uniref:DUF5675 domain-containing protein n=1 Tax=Larkinella knui TaxID=2025310 RepID=A0A3P1CDY5_9BACT|nr:DUF5675 family protein [Larkinella knui]RRB11517.1 hypothetical protein EHT87_23875 [Larkinella knui]